MTGAPLDRFAAILEHRLGLRHDERIVALAPVLARRAAARRTSHDRYLDGLGDDPDELRAIAREVTVGETYFYRHGEQLRAFADAAVPARLMQRARIEVLSAGCSSGEEPYTLAMLLHDRAPAARWRVTGADVNPAALERAGRGRYGAWALRALPPELARWFDPQPGNEVAVNAPLREAVTFTEANLLQDGPLWRPERWDVVFCRNVIMYFSAAHATAVLQRIVRAIAPGGYLFLGHAESLPVAAALELELTTQQTHGTFYYRREPGAAVAVATGSAVGPLPGAAHARRLTPPALPVLALPVPAPIARPVATTPPAAATPEIQLAEVRALVLAERYAAALARLDQLPDALAAHPDALLLRAIVLTHRGALDEAEAACQRLLATSGGHAGAWYQLALCHELAGDPASARREARRALARDPSFAMAHLRLGVLARRAGDRAEAEAELTRAIALLADEPAPRLALYGGGFSRAGLIELCRRELAALQGRDAR